MSGNPTLTDTTTTEKTPGQLALEELEAKFADMTMTECELGFGDTHCDWRAPLAKVAVYAAAEADAAEGTSEEVNADALKEAAASLHNPTPGKVEKLKKFYSELYPEDKQDDSSTTGGSNGQTPSEETQDDSSSTGGSNTPTQNEGNSSTTGGSNGQTPSTNP